MSHSLIDKDKYSECLQASFFYKLAYFTMYLQDQSIKIVVSYRKVLDKFIKGKNDPKIPQIYLPF